MSDDRLPHLEVSLAGINDPRSLHERLRLAFDFPDTYGRNWAAFWDAISGLVLMPERITFTHWADLKSVLPEDAERLRTSLARLNSEFPSFGSKVDYL
jgi:RNAse (barnase) inhibitor barstar